MKLTVRKAAMAALAFGAAPVATLALSAPAAAQVNGIATVEPAVAVASTTALQTGFQQISTQYASQRQTLEQHEQQRTQLLQQLDTNKDNQLSDAERQAAPQATVTQINTLDQQIQQIQGPMTRARLYVISQILQQYGPSLQQVIADRKIQMVIAPDSVIYAPDAANVTNLVTTALNTRVPSVQVVPPEGWQPNQTTAQLFQEIQQLLMMAAMQQQQQPQQPQSSASR